MPHSHPGACPLFASLSAWFPNGLGGAFDSPLILFATLILIGYACGEGLLRLGLPRMLGYVLLGLVLGDSMLGWLDADRRASLRLFVDVGLALLLLELGQRLDLQWMRRERWLWVIAVGEIALTWLLSFTALKLFDFTHAEAAFVAALVISTSPVVVMYMAKAEGADGQVSNRVLALATLNSLAAFVFATALSPLMRLEHEGTTGLAALARLLLVPSYRLAGSFALGVAAFLVFRFCARWYGKTANAQFVLALGMVVLTVGAANAFDLSVLGAMLTIGLLVKNADRARRIRHIDFGVAAEVFCVILFVVAGATAHFSGTPLVLSAACALVAARFVAKLIPVAAIAPLTPLGLSRAGVVTLALMPLSGFTALVLLDPMPVAFAHNGRLVSVFLAAVAILEIAGPVLVQYAFRRARESHALEDAKP